METRVLLFACGKNDFDFLDGCFLSGENGLGLQKDLRIQISSF